MGTDREVTEPLERDEHRFTSLGWQAALIVKRLKRKAEAEAPVLGISREVTGDVAERREDSGCAGMAPLPARCEPGTASLRVGARLRGS